MARPALTEEQRRQTRQNIRKAAASIYQKRGIEEVSARAIAEAAGVSVGTLYSYFDNLTELMQSLWKEPVQRLLDDLDATLANDNAPLEKLRSLFTAYAQFATDKQDIYRGAFMFVRPAAHEKPIPVALEEDRFFGMFRAAIIEGQKQKLLRKGDPNSIAQTMLSGLHGAIALPINLDRIALDTSPLRIDPMIDLLIDWVKA